MNPSDIDSETLRLLARWAKRRGFKNPKKVAESLAWRISRHSSNPLPFIRPALAEAEEEP